MATNASDADDRLPTTGPDTEQYSRYRFERTSDGDALIYDEKESEEWIQAKMSLTLDAWR